MKRFCFIGLMIVTRYLAGQTTFPVNGVHNVQHNYYAFTHATIHVDYKTVLEDATLLIRNGKVIEAGTSVSLPEGTVIFDLEGKCIYPSFIDLWSSYGMPRGKKTAPVSRKRKPPVYERHDAGARHWNGALHPERRAAGIFTVDAQSADTLRQNGFGAVLTHVQDGIARGTACLVGLGNDPSNKEMLETDAATVFAFRKGSSVQEYPTSLMGAVALLRQTFYDAEWYRNYAEKDERNISLEAMNQYSGLPALFEANNYLDVLRADTLGGEFGIQFIIKAGGDEYKRMKLIRKTGAPLILPLNFPKPFDVKDPYDASEISLAQLKHWELAPANPAFVQKAGLRFALTMAGLRSKADFLPNLRKAIRSGLSKDTALKALTYYPALFIGMQHQLGKLSAGYIANFIITSGELFKAQSIIMENWIAGRRYIMMNALKPSVSGTYDLNINTRIYRIRVEEKKGKISAFYLSSDSAKSRIRMQRNGDLIAMTFDVHDAYHDGLIRMSGKVNFKSGIWDGKALLPGGEWVDWSAIRQKDNFRALIHNDTTKTDSSIFEKVWYPCTAFGFQQIPVQEDLLFKRATVWTNEDSLGIMQNTDVLIQGGKITAIGRNLDAPDGVKTLILDGKHLTPGIIDEHAHIAISGGVNEAGQAVSAEVRIGDVLNPDDVNIYRQLRGGVTVTQCLHGSANPVGGQSAIIKHRWGLGPEDLKIKGAAPFIKFALGENVKQSNWGDLHTIRFPQSRMGVEQVFYDALTRAKEYALDWALYHSMKPKEQAKRNPPRRDLELDALAEVLQNKRFITCHSYQQGEINMMMHIADSMGFKVNTFTHVLEGYKLADQMALHGAGGSTFSDWWAYKFEVNDAIPYNMTLMHDAGIVTAVNSDDAEMGRRLTQEAAKAVKYGGMSEEEALKLCTLNPAKLLHLDSCMGSIAVGKDADIVIWSGNPLSVYSKVEKTFVDGVCYFDRQKENQTKKLIRQERMRILAKMAEASKRGEKTVKFRKRKGHIYRCDTIENEY